ncbi:MAG TPA: RNA methyltransferase [Acholeplasmataceae bacterium]|nr:MAG: RNA methyltransferase [Tenericutes bacterium GWA2_38_26]OHE31026.1 MAG: RNA methyltransferase [Tenericutes bacterium GWC2_39_45]OHE32189.1 MAG: RNA methyltransferase [Tenericutes bacterium GWD2_38_27]OHE40866.1 MAG: RNA methyltransferase [Tenericutes bacterium GWE2_38_8]HBG32154.1 RNA methyltransferase [Acholeplasmataceae bacterium]
MFHIVLYEPEIPQNTGNIMRTCVAIGAKLHLIEPLGFKIDEARLRRSALDYYEHLDYVLYKNFDDFAGKNPGTYLFLTRYGKKNYADINYKEIKEPMYLIFGKESTGVDRKLLAKHLENCYRIPTTDKVRSLNLSNAVAIVAYEALRQFDYFDLIQTEPETHKGKDFLDQFVEKEDKS